MRRDETGILPALVGLAGSELVSWLLGEVLSAPPDPDASPFPFVGACSVGGRGAATLTLASDIPADSEYRRSFQRLDDLITAAQACNIVGLDAAKLDVVRRRVAGLLNSGIEMVTDDGQTYYVCDATQRPTRGQVEASFRALQERLEALCTDAGFRELEPAPATTAPKPFGLPWWAVAAVGVAGVGAVVAVQAWRGNHAAR